MHKDKNPLYARVCIGRRQICSKPCGLCRKRRLEAGQANNMCIAVIEAVHLSFVIAAYAICRIPGCIEILVILVSFLLVYLHRWAVSRDCPAWSSWACLLRGSIQDRRNQSRNSSSEAAVCTFPNRITGCEAKCQILRSKPVA